MCDAVNVRAGRQVLAWGEDLVAEDPSAARREQMPALFDPWRKPGKGWD